MMPGLRRACASGALAASLLLGASLPARAQGAPATASAPSDLKRYNVTVRRFDPAKGPGSGVDFVLPVDSPDEEHAVSAAMSNAVAFTRKVDGGTVLPVAFACVAVVPR